jgi:hypothetical protein
MMNELTLDELKDIDYALETVYLGNSDLRKKISSMIDNYCEHEWENICCQCTLDNIYCHKCEKDMGDLKQRYEN